MNRRQIIRSIFFGTASAKALLSTAKTNGTVGDEVIVDSKYEFKSKWHLFPNMHWTGEDIWAHRLQDFCIKNGELNCLVHGLNRTVHVLTHQLSGEPKSFSAEMTLRFIDQPEDEEAKENFAGFRLGIKGRYEEYRSAIITGKGIDAGVTRSGYLFIGKKISNEKIDKKILTEKIRLSFSVTAQSSGMQFAKLKAFDKSGNTIATFSNTAYNATDWKGNIAIVSHFKPSEDNTDQHTIAVSKFSVKGDKLDYKPQQIFGAVYFAQYTFNNGALKLSAQLAPIDISNTEAHLLIKKEKGWEKISSSKINPLARVANFSIKNWDVIKSYPYKIVYELTLNNGKKKEYTYEGTVAAEPLQKGKILSDICNDDFGLSDNKVAKNAAKLNVDMAFVHGNEFYEPNDVFNVHMKPLDKACLDYLYEWYVFGWNYREIFSHIPMAALPDDTEICQGNIFWRRWRI